MSKTTVHETFSRNPQLLTDGAELEGRKGGGDLLSGRIVVRVTLMFSTIITQISKFLILQMYKILRDVKMFRDSLIIHNLARKQISIIPKM